MNHPTREQHHLTARRILDLQHTALDSVPALMAFVNESVKLAKEVSRQMTSTITEEHFKTVAKWSPVNQIEALKWACEVGGTVGEMRAWMRAQHGCDLSVNESPDFEELMAK